MAKAQEWLDKEYPLNGICQGNFDSLNKGKKRKEIRTLRIYGPEQGLWGTLKLEGFDNLEDLFCSSWGGWGRRIYKLTGIDVGDCLKLKKLNCSYNWISSLDVTKNMQLIELDCEDNQIAVLDVSQNTQLKKLDCLQNKLTKLDLTNCPDLENLICAQNNLNNLDLSNCRNLTHLDCWENKITNLKIVDLPLLAELNCWANCLTNLDFDAFNPKNLVKVSLSDNNFSFQNLNCFSRFTNLKEFSIGNASPWWTGCNHFYGSLKSLKDMNNLEELETLRAEKARLERELRGAEKDQTRLEKKLGETEQELQTNQKAEDLLLQEQLQESDLLLTVSSTEVKEKTLKEKYPGLAKLLNETKNKLKADDYKWLIKIFEAQEELISLENRVNPRPKTKEISEAKWKLRSFQSKLKKEKLGEVLIKSKELIEKQVKSQPTSSSMKRSGSAGPMRRQLSNPQRVRIQQSESRLF